MTFEERRSSTIIAFGLALNVAKEMQISVHAVIEMGGAICSSVILRNANDELRFLDAIPIPRLPKQIKPTP